MNKQNGDILNELLKEPFQNQRILAENAGYSLGVINRSLKNLIREGYLNDNMGFTEKAKTEFYKNAPQNAIILAAGFGMRMVPINMEIPKGLLEINNEPLIERTIRQLHEVGVQKIYIVVGFMKERYEYLIDMYGVELIVNEEYETKNNLHSLKHAAVYLSNSYIIPCDIWCEENPYRQYEPYSWYMVSSQMIKGTGVRVNRKSELVRIPEEQDGNMMIGISYVAGKQAAILREQIEVFCRNSRYDGAFWEEILYHKERMIVLAKVVQAEKVAEINTYEQLRELDCDSSQLDSDIIKVICLALGVETDEVKDISVLKKGMTNRSFFFSCKGKKYIMRIPGAGTEQLINRKQEAAVYNAIRQCHLCDEIVYINPSNGYKITEFLENARVCDPLCEEDVQKCMKILQKFHEQKLFVEHEFDIFGQIEFYENLWNGSSSIYRDYQETKREVLKLKKYIDVYAEKKVLTHIDAVPDNFLFVQRDGYEDIRLIDWEYAGMQDPHVDVAMFAIYSLYSRQQVDDLISAYFPKGCSRTTRIKIYCYISVCGLLWSNWCEYKRQLGIDFGEYSLRQYRFAKDYYRLVQEEIKKGGSYECTE
ncbi:MAG: NTP transferase domain-containing protein [Lachnospiraceae bacterium]|jgi:CTP:phosphocholine cytidylyltransferase-like protein/thiamine kinase-like enzyme|nr:NTP transferase domain-containing protein [Lachnospiraceae bacterium]